MGIGVWQCRGVAGDGAGCSGRCTVGAIAFPWAARRFHGRLGPQGNSFPCDGQRRHSERNQLVSAWNEFHAECTERVFDKSQFNSACNEFHLRCNGLASGWNSFHSDRSLFDPGGAELPLKRR